MGYLSTVSVLPRVDGGRHASSLEKRQEFWCRKISNELLWTGTAAKHIYCLCNTLTVGKYLIQTSTNPLHHWMSAKTRFSGLLFNAVFARNLYVKVSMSLARNTKWGFNRKPPPQLRSSKCPRFQNAHIIL